MQLLPAGWPSLLGLAIIVGGVAFIVVKRDVPKAYGLGVLIMALFLLDTLARFRPMDTTMQEQLGFTASEFFAGNQWWSPLTAMFVHAPPASRSVISIHAVGNLFLLIAAGPALEARLGARRFLAVFFAAGIGGFVAHVLLAYTTPITTPDTLALGASGAIFGVLTTLAVRYPNEKVPVILLFFIMVLPAWIVLLIFMGFNFVYMFTSAGGVAWWGHFAGLLVGLAFAARLPKADADLTGNGGAIPDADKLEPYASTPQLKEIVAKVRQFSPDARTQHDSTFAQAWVDKFFAKAECPNGHAFRRHGMRATCTGGETSVEFARAGTR